MDDQDFNDNDFQQPQNPPTEENKPNSLEDPFGDIQGSSDFQPMQTYEEMGSPMGIPEPDQQQTKKIHQEEEASNEKLRKRADQEYEKKEQRKRKGKEQLDVFLSKKESETGSRKEQNLVRQQDNKKQRENISQGWVKVGESVSLKMGDHKGTKEIGRMREAMVNKRRDQQGE